MTQKGLDSRPVLSGIPWQSHHFQPPLGTGLCTLCLWQRLLAQGKVLPEQYCGTPLKPPRSIECQPRCPDRLCTLEMGTAWAQGVALLCHVWGCHSCCHRGLHKPRVIPTWYLPLPLFPCVRHGCAVRCVLERGEDMLITAGRHPYLGKYKVSRRREGGFVLYVYSCCNVP